MRVSIALALLAFFAGNLAFARFAPLDEQSMQSAVFMETLSLPSAGEYFSAVDKRFEPNWTKLLRPMIPVATPLREHLALQIGVLIADCHIAIEAQDGQATKNYGRDILNLAKKLNVSQNVLARGQNISDLAEKGDWLTLREELDAMQNDIRLSMQEQNDYDLLVFLMIGSWVRQMEVACDLFIQTPTPDASELLIQPEILNHLLDRLHGLPEKSRANPMAQTFLGRLQGLQPIMSQGSLNPLPEASVQDISATMKAILNISSELPPKP